MSAVVHRALDWDSEQLGLRTGMLEVEDPEQVSAQRIVSAIPQGEVLTALKLPAGATALVTSLLQRGARLVDVEHTFGFVGPAPDPPTAEVRCLDTIEPGPLLDLAPEMTFSRFFRDDRIAPGVAEALWCASIRNHCEGLASRLAVAFLGGLPVGLVACRDHDGTRALFSVGLLPSARGRGLAKAMIGCLVADAGDMPLSVEALASNHAAIGLYTCTGFRLQRSHYVLHLWHEETAAHPARIAHA